MVFNKLPKEMRRTLALTLAASMVATGTQTPVLADQVQEVSVQEVQNAQTEAGEEQNVRAAEQQEEVPVAEEQTGTDKSVQKQTLSANEVNPVDPVTDPNGQESKIETQAAEEEEIEAETADGEVTSATYVEIVVQDQEGNYAGKVNCGFDFDSVNHTARLVRILPAENESDRTAVDEKSSVKLIIKTVSYNKEEYTVNTIYNDGGICGAGLPNLDLVIGKEVTLIGTNAFKDVGAKTPVKSVTFEAESGLKEIGDYAFSAANLSGEVILPQSVEILGEGAFRGTACTKFTFEAGSKMTAMGDSVFANCGKLTEVENFPSGITKIPDSSFMSDKVLAKVTYAAPEKMTGIGASAFSGCEVLVSDASYSPITENMVTIGASAFMGCKGEQFTTVTIPASVTKLEQNTFANCLSLATVTFTNTESVTEIAAKCFANDGALTECELPAKLEVLGDSAFGATALTHVRIPVTLREAKQPFSKCQQIGQIEWEEGLTKVIDNLFQNMESSLKVDFQNQITEIGNHAFDSSLITGITGTNKLVKIGEYAFNSCAGISGKVELPAVTEIHAYAFSKIFATDFEISENITLIDNSAFMNCTNLKAINKNDGVADVDLGNMTKLAEIGKQAFAGCSSIVSLRLSGTITKINDSAFSKLTTLANVKFNDNGEAGTTELGSSVFSGCTNLVEVSTAKNVGIIGSSAFSGCIKLMRLNLAEGLQIIKSGAFSGCARLEGALPEGVSEKYSSASGAKVMLPNEKAVLEIPGTVTAIEDSAFASCYSADETLQADGEKEPSDYKIGIKAVHIAGNPAGTTIGASAFAGCQNLTKLTLGEGVTGLGDSALKDTRLEEITIPSTFETGTAKNSPFTSGENSTLKKVTFADGIQVIPQYFLNNITTLTKIEIPASVQKIGDHAFADCSNLTAVTFKEQADSKLTTIDTSAFEGCSLMKLSKLPEGLTTINASAFKDCKKISLTDLPTGLITIGNAAFENCTMLRIGKLPAITALGMAAFKNCVKLPFLSVDTSNLAEINATAFEGCTGLSSVQINGGEKKQTTIADGAFATCNSLKWLDIENVKSIGKNAFAKLPFSALEINQVDTIGESAFASCDKLENPVIQNVKTIGASAFAGSGAQTDDNKVLLDSIQNVGSRAFEGCQFTSADIRDLEKVTTYTDPETKIEYSPFAKSSIKKVEFSDETKNTVCTKAFKNVTSLQSVELAYCFTYGNISTIDASAFEGCVNLTDINLSDKLTTINGLAFYNTGLTEITVPASLTKITTASAAGKNVGPFAGGVLRKVTFADGVTKSLQGMFMGTTSLEEVVLPKSLKTIDQNAFKDCSSLKKLSVGKSGGENVLDTVETINAGAFNGCSSLETLTLKNVAKIDSSDTNRTFGGCTSLKKVSVTGVTTTDNTGKTTLSTTIGTSAFKDNKALKEINLDTIKTVSQEAFRGCGVADDGTDPATLTLNNVNAIGSLAFYGCGFKAVQIPRQLTSVATGKIDGVEYGPFAGGKLETVSFGTLINTIPDNLCMNTTSLQKIELQSVKASLRTIGKNAFKGCTSVEEVTIPKGILTVSNSAFEGCSGLTDVTIAAKTINAKAFAECKNLKAVKMEEGVTTIQGMAFANTQISAVTIPSTLTTAGTTKEGTIEKGPFAGTMIATVHGQTEDSTEAQEGATILPETKKIPDNLFLGCTSIIDVQIPETVTEIGQKAFKDASSVENVTFAVNTETGKVKGVEKIGISAFDGCSSLQELVLPETVTEVLQGAFANEGALVKADMSRTASLKKWDKESFKGDTALAEVILPTAGGITAIPDGAFAGCTTLTGENLKIPKNIVTITANAFKESGLKKLYIPNQVTTIGASAFEACKNLEDVHISNNISIISQSTFKNCEKLEKIEIPVKVDQIGTNAFYGSGLKDVYIFGDPEIGGGITNTYAGMKNQLSVFEKEVVDETASAVSQHIFNANFTIHGGGNTKLKTAFFDTYRTETDGPSVPNVADGKGTIAIYSTSLANTDQPCMKWDSLDEAVYRAAAIKLDQSELTMMLKNKKAMVASVIPADETKEDSVLDALTWESSDEKIAKVDANGVITANAEGTVTITAKAGDVKAECKVKVISPINTCVMQKEGGTDSLISLALRGGESIAVTFDVKKSNKQASDEYTIKAGDASVISVEKKDKSSNTYVITALKKGKTSIICSATDGSEFTQTFDVTVDSTQHIVADPTKFTNNNEDGSRNYEANTKDSWTYHVDGVSEIKITFDPVTEVEPDHDFILVYDKDGKSLLYDGDTAVNGVATVVAEDSTVKYKYTGDQLDDRTFTVKGDTVRVQIDADASGERYGFKVSKVVTKNTIDYKLNGGLTKNNPNPYSFSSDSTEPVILKDATREDAIFVGWYTDKACTIPITEIKPGIGGVTVYAKWQENPAVIYKLNGAPDSVNKQNPKYVPFDNEEEIVLQAIEREGYTFLGWYTDKECTKQITAIPAHTKVALTIYAKWEKKTAPAEPTPTPTPVPTPEPSKVPTPQPSKTPAPEPSKTPSQEPAKTPENKPAKAGTQLSTAEAGASYQVVSEDEKQPTVVYTAPADKNVKKITVPATITVGGITYKVESVAPDAFKNCRKLTSVKISAGVQKIGKNAFSGCSKLSSVTIGKDVTEIGAGAFANCKALKKITIPAAVTKIGKKAFNKCKKLKTVTIKTKKLKTVGGSAFKEIAKKAVIKLPKAKKAAYKKLLKKKYDKTTKLK
ncbi:MAG: leucine-rich repeat protein [Lachnospiraceae bacterium]|nr:leucine-rich repeat protein [Lachnospiraceae bacterium]